MRTSVPALLALGAALAVSGASYASEGASKPFHHHHLLRHKAIDHRHAVDAGATAYAPPIVLPIFGLWANSSTVHQGGVRETDGLSRNPDDCAMWGCVDNGGG
jgi:hypothetical protein